MSFWSPGCFSEIETDDEWLECDWSEHGYRVHAQRAVENGFERPTETAKLSSSSWQELVDQLSALVIIDPSGANCGKGRGPIGVITVREPAWAYGDFCEW